MFDWTCSLSSSSDVLNVFMCCFISWSPSSIQIQTRSKYKQVKTDPRYLSLAYSKQQLKPWSSPATEFQEWSQLCFKLPGVLEVDQSHGSFFPEMRSRMGNCKANGMICPWQGIDDNNPEFQIMSPRFQNKNQIKSETLPVSQTVHNLDMIYVCHGDWEHLNCLWSCAQRK